MKIPRIIVTGMLLLCCACGNEVHSGENPAHKADHTDSFTTVSVENPAEELEWRLKQGQKDAPVQIRSCTLNEKQELILQYKNVSADEIDVVRIVLLGYDRHGDRQDFEPGTTYRYVTDQQAVRAGKSATIVYPLQQKLISRVEAYVVKAHYTAGGNWENH